MFGKREIEGGSDGDITRVQLTTKYSSRVRATVCENTAIRIPKGPAHQGDIT